MPIARKLIALLLSIMLYGWPVQAADQAGLFGSAELSYGEHRAEEGGTTVFDNSHFTQQYSLLYERRAELSGGRAGKYELALGYEWNSIDAKVDGEDTDIDSGKVLYRGDLLIAPGGLPFRLHLYSQDMHRSAFLREADSELFRSMELDGVLRRGVISNISNGQHLRSGATLMVGIRNGSYLGRYREVLSQFPRLFVDYSEDYVRDLKSATPQKYRTRNLAFVSLNKKDNWFHYRLLEHTNYLNRSEDYAEKTLLLGSIDHLLRRQWINFTNWLKVSVDGSYTSMDRRDVDESEFNRYDLNMFAVGKRSWIEASTFTTFSNVRQLDQVDKNIDVPIFLKGTLNRDTAWRFGFTGSRDRSEAIDSGAQTDEDIAYASLRVDARRQQRVQVNPELEFEAKSGDFGKGYAARAAVEAYSNRRFRPKYDFFTSYSLARFGGEGTELDNVGFWEQEAVGRIETALSRSFRSGFQQNLLYGTGTLDRSVSRNITPKSDLDLGLSSAGVEERSGDVFRSTTSWFGEHNKSRLFNRYELTYDYLSAPERDSDQVVASHSLRYDQRSFRANLKNRIVIGDHTTSSQSFGGSGLGEEGGLQSASRSFEHSTNLRFTPGRQFDTGIRGNFSWFDEVEGSSTHWLVRQDATYSIYKVNGIIRKLAQLRQELQYERLAPSVGAQQTAALVIFSADYHPTKYTLLGGKLGYRRDMPDDTDTFTWELYAGLDFEKLQLDLSYSYGKRTGDDEADRLEHLWEARVKKVF